MSLCPPGKVTAQLHYAVATPGITEPQAFTPGPFSSDGGTRNPRAGTPQARAQAWPRTGQAPSKPRHDPDPSSRNRQLAGLFKEKPETPHGRWRGKRGEPPSRITSDP